jgi:hypothetical protein
MSNVFYTYKSEEHGFEIYFVSPNGKETSWIFRSKEDRDKFYDTILRSEDSYKLDSLLNNGLSGKSLPINTEDFKPIN